MNFLSPTTIAIAAGLTIPPLIALYFLKLKRVARTVPSTFLWKRSVEDLQVNSPFQRLRSSLLLLLQLLVLIAAALALGKPMFQTVQTHDGTIVILVDQSASMNVIEEDGRTRLDIAKEHARRCVENMADDARAMVIAFCDRANVVSSFDSDKRALQRKIDGIEPTHSTSSLQEAMNLAEAYTQNIIIGGEEAGSDRLPESVAPVASVFLFSDGRIEQADKVSLQRFDVEKIRMTTVGKRSDNVGILAMAARRNYEKPDVLEVTAMIRNFGYQTYTFDVVLFVDNQSVDVQTISLQPALDTGGVATGEEPALGSVKVIAFDEIEYRGGGVVEVVLRVDDALPMDNRAWSIIESPRHVQILLVSNESPYLEEILSTLPVTLTRMTGDEYETADEKSLTDGYRSLFDVVIFDRHSTQRLPLGSYFFWGSVPKIDGVSMGENINNQVIFNWDDTHPILRHVGIETLRVFEWYDLQLPTSAVSLIDGETSSVLSHLIRGGSQYLICAFSLTVEGDSGDLLKNTFWMASADFVIFMQNAVSYLGSTLAATGRRSVVPGAAVMLPLPGKVKQVRVSRPDGETDSVSTTGMQNLLYVETRVVGPYRVEPGVPGNDQFAVNLFNAVESGVEPAPQLAIGAESMVTQAGAVETNAPAWPYLMLAILVLLMLEWAVYNRRVYV